MLFVIITALLLITTVSANSTVDISQADTNENHLEKSDNNIPINDEKNIEKDDNYKTINDNVNKNKNVKEFYEEKTMKADKNIKSDSATRIEITATNTTVYQSNYITVTLYNGDTPLENEKVELNFNDSHESLVNTTRWDGKIIFMDYFSYEYGQVNVMAIYEGNPSLGYAPCTNSTTFMVNKIQGYPMTINANDTTATVETPVNLKVGWPKNYTGLVIINDSFENTLYNNNVTFTNGNANITYTPLACGPITIALVVRNNDALEDNYTSTTVNAVIMPTTTTISAPKSVHLGEDIPVTVTVKDQKQRIVNRGIGRIIVNNTDSLDFNAQSATVKYPTTNKGKVPVKVEYDGLENVYSPSISNEVLVDILAADTAINIVPSTNVTAHRQASATVTLTSGNVILKDEEIIVAVKQDNKDLDFTTTTSSDGTKTITFTPLSNSSVNITAKYDGSNNYNQSSKDAIVIVSSMPTKLDVKVADVMVNDTLKINITLVDEDNNKLAGKQLTAKVNGIVKELMATSDGDYFIEYSSDKSLTDVSVEVTYNGEGGYLSSSNTGEKFNVKKIPTTVNIKVDNPVINNFTTTITVNAQKAIVNEGSVTLYANDTVIGKSAVKNGVATITNTTMKYGKYTLKAEYTGVDVFNNSKATGSASTELIDTTLRLQLLNKTVFINETVMITATLTNGSTPISNQIIKFTFNDSQTMTVSTNANGQATVKYNSTGEYKKISVYAQFDETSTYKKQNTTADTFTVNKLKTNTTVSVLDDMVNNVTIEVTVKSNGQTVKSGTLQIVVDKKQITQKVDSSGKTIIPLNITKSGKTPVSVSFKEDKQYLSSQATNESGKIFENITVKQQSSKITVKVNNATVDVDSTVNISGKLTYANSKQVTNAPITIKVNNESINTKTDSNGNYSIKYTPSKEAKYDITATYDGNVTNITKATAKTSFNAKRIKTTTTIKVLNNTVVDTRISIEVKDAYSNAITCGTINLTVNDKTQTVTIKNAVTSIKLNTTTNKALQVTAKYTGSNKYLTSNDTETIKVTKTNVTIKLDKINPVKINQSYTIKATVTDLNNQPVKEGTVIIYNNNTEIARMNLTNGAVTTKNTSKYSGNYNITARYTSSDKYNDATNSTTLTVNKLNTTITIDNVDVVVGDEASFNVHVKDENNKNVHGGKVVLKLNGVSLTDSKGNVIQQQVINGTATIKYNIPLSWTKANYNISAVYGGTSNTFQSSRSINYKLTTRYRTAKLDLTITPKTNKMDKISTFTVKVTDNGKNVNGGVVIFKINGQTIKDSSKKTVQVNVVNGIASYNYTLPDGLKAADYNITAVYANKNYNRAEINSTLTAVRANIHFNVTVTVNKRVVTIKGKLLDEYNHTTLGTNTLSVKLNKITLKDANYKAQSFNATGGIIDITFTLPDIYKAKEYSLELVTGQRYAYNGQRYTKTIKIE